MLSLNWSSSWINALTADAEIEQDVTDNVIMPDGFFLCLCSLDLLRYSGSFLSLPRRGLRHRRIKDRGRIKGDAIGAVRRNITAIRACIERQFFDHSSLYMKQGYLNFENSRLSYIRKEWKLHFNLGRQKSSTWMYKNILYTHITFKIVLFNFRLHTYNI